MRQFGAKQGKPMKPTNLSDLYPSGTRLSEVHPLFEGMSLDQWQILKIKEQCDELAKATTQEERDKAPLNRKAVATKRNSYGMNGI